MLMDCGVLCEGLRSGFPRQSKGWDVIHILRCFVSVPLSYTLLQYICLYVQLYPKQGCHKIGQSLPDTSAKQIPEGDNNNPQKHFSKEVKHARGWKERETRFLSPLMHLFIYQFIHFIYLVPRILEYERKGGEQRKDEMQQRAAGWI